VNVYIYVRKVSCCDEGFLFTDLKMFKPKRIMMVIQPVLLNIRATEFLLETGLKQTFWKIFNLVLNIQVILIPSVTLIPF